MGWAFLISTEFTNRLEIFGTETKQISHNVGPLFHWSIWFKFSFRAHQYHFSKGLMNTSHFAPSLWGLLLSETQFLFYYICCYLLEKDFADSRIGATWRLKGRYNHTHRWRCHLEPFGGSASCLKTVGHLDCKRFKQRTFQLLSTWCFMAALTHDFKPQFLTLKCLIKFSQCWNTRRSSYLQLWNSYSILSCVVKGTIAIYLNTLSTLHIIILPSIEEQNAFCVSLSFSGKNKANDVWNNCSNSNSQT